MTIGGEIKAVSFDVFDTLVVRNVAVPEDVFELTAIRYNRLYPHENLPVNFCRLRMDAEKSAREKKGKCEVTLNEIYQCMDGIDNQLKERILQMEIEAEYAICQPNYEMKAWFDHLAESGRKIIIASDMYLPKTVIINILEKCGYKGYFSLYVSSEYGDTKVAGGLYDRILLDLQIKAAELLHIGDNLRADNWIPKMKGIQTFLYKKKRTVPLFFKRLHRAGKASLEGRLQFQLLQRMIANQNARKNPNEKIGYEILGPILLGYSMWLKKQMESKKTENIVFLAREGALLKKAFETLYQTWKKAYYVNVSRLGMCRAGAGETATWQELEKLFLSVLRGVETVEEFLNLIGLTRVNETLLEKYHLDKKRRLDEIENKSALFQFIKLQGNTYFGEQKQLLKEYLLQNGFDKKSTAISDIGWSGTMQMLLAKKFPDIDLEGYYLAVSDFQKSSAYLSCKRNGYFCGAGEWEQEGKMIRFSQSAIEILFLGNEGTTLEYRKENGRVVPLKAGQENKGVGVEIIEAVQDGAIHFLEDCQKASIMFFFDELDKKTAFEPCLKFLVFPHRETINFYKRLKFVDGMNVFSFVPKHRLMFYLFHPLELKKELEVNTSRVLWLKALLKLPLPYYKIFCFLTGRMRMTSSYAKKYVG